MGSPSEALQRLDKMLSEIELKGKPRDLSSDPEYLEQHKQYRTKGNWRLVDANTSTVAEVVCEMLQSTSESLPFRLCSVGCGNGGFDKQALEKVLSKFPEAKLHYVGIEINRVTCQKAEECLGTLPGVTVETHAGDIQEMDMTALEQSFDLVMCINSLYYVQRLDIALEKCMKMMKPQGKLIIINSGQHPLSDLYRRFWLHQNKTPLMFTPEIKQALSAMGVDFVHKSSNSCTVDFTEYFEDDFQKTYQKHILNFIVQVNIEVYPPAVVQLVKDYLWSIAEGTPEKVLVPSTHDAIVVTNVARP